MKKKLYSLFIITLMITISFFTFISNSILAIDNPGGNPPVYQANFNWTKDPDGKNYCAEEYTFNGCIQGGLAPYDFTWEWDDGTDPDHEYNSMDIYTSASYIFRPHTSPHEYDVKLSVEDSHNPPWTTYRTKTVTVYIDYDIWIDNVAVDYQIFEYGEDITGKIILKNSNYTHSCPLYVKYNVSIWEWINIWDRYVPLRDPEFWEESEIGIDLRPGQTKEFYFNLGNPPPNDFGDWYKVKGEITYAPYDDNTQWHTDWSQVFVVI